MAGVVVTGGSGFIGTNLVEHYRRAGATVLSFDTEPPRHPLHHDLWRRVDVLDRAHLAAALAITNPSVVFHMAARTDLDSTRVEDYRVNTDGVTNVIEALRALPSLEVAVFASSMLVCRMGYHPRDEQDYCPTTAYGASKVEGERLVRERAASAFAWLIVRPTSIWGPWFRAPYSQFFEAVRRGLYVHPRGLRVRRSYGFVLNTVAQLACLQAARSGGLVGRAVYLADYEPLDVKQWADAIRRQSGAAPVREMPMWLFRAAAGVGDALRLLGVRDPPMTRFRLQNLSTEMVHDLAPLRTSCGTLPYSMEQGVALTCSWLDEQGR